MLASTCKRFLVLIGILFVAFALPTTAQQAQWFLYFDGTNDYLQVADTDAFSFGNGTADAPLTFEFWFRPDVVTSQKQNILTKWSEPSNVEYRMYIGGGTLRLDLRDASANAGVAAYVAGNITALQGAWHHAAVTYDGRGGAFAANGISFFIDGVAVAVLRENNPAYVAMENSTRPLEIGREGQNYKQYRGGLDDVRIWSLARTGAQIQASMNAELLGPIPGLVSYWKFNEGTGVLASDSIGGASAALFNGPAWTTGSPVGPPSEPDLTPPAISNISSSNLTDSGITITFATDEPATGWVSLTPSAVCPCVDVYSGGVGTSHTIVVSGLTQDTPYTYFVKATDAATNLTVGPEMGFRTLVTPTDSTPPVVSITNPQPGTTVSGNVIITAIATDNHAVAGVQFRIDGVDLGSEDTTFPYSVAWDLAGVAEGAHSIAAVARDAANNSATALASVTVSSAQPPSTPWYLEFDGSNDFLQTGDADDLTFGNGVSDAALTFEFWFRPGAVTGPRQSLLAKWAEPTGGEYRLYLGASTLRLDLRDNSSNAIVSALVSGTLASLQGTWHHVAVTYDGRGGANAANGIAFYIDGVAVAVTRQNNPAYVAMENWTRPLEIGREGPNYKQYLGGLDDLRIWNVLRTPSQIQASMNAELTTSLPGLLAYWKFNEGAGVVADDAAGDHNATLFNGPLWTPGGPVSSPSQQAPAFTSGNATTLQTTVTGSFTIETTGQPTPVLSITGTLPSGVSFSDHGDGTAVLGGTPAAGSGGSYPLTFSASNGIGQPATQSFTLTVNQAPAITSAASTSFQSGSAATFTVTTNGFPGATLSVSGSLPTGVSFTNNGNGTATIAATAAANPGGVYPVTITASNGVAPQATQNFVLTMNQAPAITSAPTAALQIGIPGSFMVAASGYPVPAITASGVLPSGVTFGDLGNGSATISGTPALGSGGTYALTISANNGVGVAASQNLVLSIPNCVVTPAPGSVTPAVLNSPYTFTFIAAGGSGHTFALTSGIVASGLSLSSAGVLSGTPTATGSFAFTVTATNSIGCVASSNYTMQVAPDAQDETFENAVGNTQYSVGAGTPATPAVVVSGSVLTNDAGSGALTAGPASIATTNGGVVAMAAQGSFLYTPSAGFAGPTDSFTYTLTDGNGASDTAVVTINLSGIVWYVNGAAGAGDGRSASPFNTMTAASAAAQTGQIVYVHSGSPAGAFVMKTGQSLLGAGSLFTMNGLTIPAGAQPTITGTVTLANDVYLRSLSINGGAGAAIAANGLSGVESLEAVSVSGGTTGLDIANLGGTLNMIGGTISGVSAGTDVRILGGTGNISIGASISNTGSRSIDVQNRTAGAVTFSGAINDTGTGLLLNANSGSTITFAGGLTLTTGANNAFTATGGGTVSVTQDNVNIINTITTTSGAALTVANTEIGAAGMTFRRITAGTSTLSAGSGILLDSTGIGANNGGLTITGNGSAQSGGIIRRKTGADGSFTQGVGISLNNTKNPSFSWMDLNNFDNAAIAGRDVFGLLISNSVVSAAGTNAAVVEGPIVFGQPGVGGFNGLLGSGVIRDTVVSGGIRDSVAFYNHSGNMTLSVERTGPTPGQCQIGQNSTTTGGHGLLLQLSGTATGTATVTRCRFRDVRQAAVMASASDDAQLSLTVTGSPTTGSLKSEFIRTGAGQGQEGIVVTNSGNAVVTATIENAVFNAHASTAIRLGQQTGNASATSLLQATIRGNQFEMTLPAGNNGGIVGTFSSTAGQASRTRLLLSNNFVNQWALPPAFAFRVPDDGSTPQVDLTMISNHADMHEISPGSGIRGPIGMIVEGLAGSICASTANNISHLHPVGVSPQAGGLRLAQAGSALFSLEQGNQPLGSSPSMVLSANNPAPVLSVMVTEALGSISVVPNGSCVVPSVP